MSLTIRKWFFAWGEEKEQAFLEDMARKGYKLVDVGIGKYTFDTMEEPKELIYQFDFKGLKQDDIDEYLQLHEDDGWEMVSTLGSWYYFCKEKTDELDLGLFNDNASKKEKYKRLLLFLCVTGFPVYYQLFIMIPMYAASATMSEFYGWFQFLLYPICGLHMFALIKILLKYRALNHQIHE